MSGRHSSENGACQTLWLVAAVLGMIERLGINPTVDQLVPKRHQGLTPGTCVALGILAKLCAPDKSWRGFGPWIQKTSVPERWALSPTRLDSQNFWDHWDPCAPKPPCRPRPVRNLAQLGSRGPLDAILYDSQITTQAITESIIQKEVLVRVS